MDTLKVSQLIERLQKCDQDKSVTVQTESFEWREGSFLTVEETESWVIIKIVEY